MARTRLAPVPVAAYAGVFVLVNVTYLLLIRELVDRPAEGRRMMQVRSVVTLLIFLGACLLSLKFPLWGLGLCCACLAWYVRPDAPRVGTHKATTTSAGRRK